MEETKPRIICDLDATLTLDNSGVPYEDKEPNVPLIERLWEYRAAGFEIVVFTSRNMKTFQGNVGKISKHTLPIILEWLDRHQVPYDEIYVGKPWCGEKGFYIDDRAIRPNEFVSMSPEEIGRLIEI